MALLFFSRCTCCGSKLGLQEWPKLSLEEWPLVSKSNKMKVPFWFRGSVVVHRMENFIPEWSWACF